MLYDGFVFADFLIGLFIVIGFFLLLWVVFLKVTIWAVRGSLGNVKKDREDKK